MPRPLPEYYSTLGPFADHFRQGRAILCYHKIEPVPPQARIKGLYLTPDLFSRQVDELGRAGFAFAPPARPRTGELPTVTVTFDDGFLSNLTEAVPRMASTGCRAINYLVADRIGQTSDWEATEGGEARPLMNEGQVKEWLAAGHWIGAHTCTHPRLSRLSREQAREEISASRKKLEDRFGIPIEHFAYPYGDYSEATVEIVREAGFRTAVTMHRGINRPTDEALELKRWTARYESLTLRNLLRRIF